MEEEDFVFHKKTFLNENQEIEAQKNTVLIVYTIAKGNIHLINRNEYTLTFFYEL